MALKQALERPTCGFLSRPSSRKALASGCLSETQNSSSDNKFADLAWLLPSSICCHCLSGLRGPRHSDISSFFSALSPFSPSSSSSSLCRQYTLSSLFISTFHQLHCIVRLFLISLHLLQGFTFFVASRFASLPTSQPSNIVKHFRHRHSSVIKTVISSSFR